MNMGDDNDGGKLKKRDPLKKKHRIKTSTAAKATEAAEKEAQTSTPVTNDQEPQEKRKESVDQNNIQDGPTIEEPKEENKGAIAEEEVKVKEVEGSKDQPDDPAAPEANAAKETETKTLDQTDPPENNSVPSGKLGPAPKRPPKFKQRAQKQFKSKPPKKGVLGFGDDIPGMDGLGTDITVICPWEAFSHLELHELAQFGII